MKRDKLRLRQLEALMAVVDHGSITNAAGELGISQPAVSRLLSDLGDRLGFSLFDRRQGQLVPSQEVRFLTPDIRRVLELMRQISDVSQEITKRRAGHIRIACLPGFATSHLPHVVATFLAERPGVSMTIEPDRPERILEWMIGEQYDFGVTDGFAGHPAVESTSLELRTVCVFPAGHRFEQLNLITPADMATENIIHTRRDSEFFIDLSNAFQAAQVEFDSLVEIRQFTAACELVCQGMGVAVVSELDARKYLSQGIGFRPFKPVVPHRLSLVRPITRQPSMVTLEFMEHFADSLKPYLSAPNARNQRSG
ncbi:MAG: LysR substrate-binding domain-containing protein [Rhodobiaceae bacterium]|jgi:DNA-binding transcriptional LysR family regulator